MQMGNMPSEVTIGKTTAFAAKLQQYMRFQDEYVVLAVRDERRFGWPTNDDGILVPLNRIPTQIEVEYFAKEIEMLCTEESSEIAEGRAGAPEHGTAISR
jgi:hypothetical protein